jgi:signal transduction histidine kinase
MVLAGAAVLIPCGAWYYLGSRQLERETESLAENARREATSTAERMALHLTVRLEELDDHETNRPFTHYWPQYQVCLPGCTQTTLQWSALARAKRHKLVAAYFQIDELGRVSTPDHKIDVRGLKFTTPTFANINAETASQIRAIKTSTGPLPPLRAAAPPAPDQAARVSSFRWQTGAWRGQSALLGVRQVNTVGTTFTQGFVVDRVALLHFPSESGLSVELLPGEPTNETEARLPILGAAWHVSVDPTPRLMRAKERAVRLSRQFHQSFFAGTTGAALAGIFLVVLIRRSERLAADRSRFAAAAAHELRTPLAGIRLHGEMLGLSLGNPSRVTEYAGRITDEAERLTRLVANVFNYTQVDQKRLRLQRVSSDLGQTVRAALTLMEPILERSGARLVVTIADDLPRAQLDVDAVHQMVRNLIDNAEKYSRGAIDRHIEVTVTEGRIDAQATVTLSVRDHGPGVPESDQDLIFDPFSRSSAETDTSGLGLGLSVVRTLARAHDGDVGYVAPATGGAAFVVWFPVSGPATED